MFLSQVFVLICLVMQVQADCNGYYHQFSNMTNCGGDLALVKWINSSAEMTDKCEVIVSSCALIQPFKSAKVHVETIKESLVIYNWDGTLCQKNLPEMMKFLFALFGLPFKCNMETAITLCRNREKIVTLGEASKRLLPLFASAPGVFLKMEIIHVGGKSCFYTYDSVRRRT